MMSPRPLSPHLWALLLVVPLILGLAMFDVGPSRSQASTLPDAAAGTTAVAPLISYQGRLVNPTTGAPLSGSFTFVFRIYNVDSGGAALWTETKDLVVTNGLFTTLLGDTTVLPTAIFDGQNLWLGIKVGADAEAVPRQRIAAVAYALYGANADLLDGQDSAFYRSATNINAGTLADARIPAAITRDSEVVPAVLAADGAGSGLDADLLDGQDSAFYRSATNINAGTLADARIPAAITRDSEVVPAVLAADGAGSGLDADLLDGQDSAAFAAAVHAHDARYFTQAQAESRYVNVTGDTMTGSSGDPILAVANTGAAATSYGVYGSTASTANGAAGVRGSAGLPGVGISGKYGVLGQSDSGKGIVGVSTDSYGTYGFSTNSWGVRGEGQNGGVYGLAWTDGSDAIRGTNTAAAGASWGVVGTSASSAGKGVVGTTSSESGETYGVYGSSASTTSGGGVRGDGPWVGVWGDSSGRWGVYGRSTGTSNSYGVYGTVTSGTGNYAGYFAGSVNVTGNLSVGGTKAFRIDHPLDPANQYLYHFAVESPQVQNLYNGTIALDAKGEAAVTLPAYFDALNAGAGFTYQLTCIGGYAPVYIAEEVSGNQFKIAGGRPGLKVSWQVTALRDDPYLRDHPVQAETNKAGNEVGTYQYPAGYGKPAALAFDQEPGGAATPAAVGGDRDKSGATAPELQFQQP